MTTTNVELRIAPVAEPYSDRFAPFLAARLDFYRSVVDLEILLAKRDPTDTPIPFLAIMAAISRVEHALKDLANEAKNLRADQVPLEGRELYLTMGAMYEVMGYKHAFDSMVAIITSEIDQNTAAAPPPMDDPPEAA